ncbi:phospholipase D-like domain-containing protein [Gordonia hydrophobica]|uniref:Phospholipase D-like domain-containing protein n=1 Tax=Gordonia hydrophobica TaxID=40516 RepID=A0ABZ2U790_9ACTN|nr:phospholipase D-like domain-containing protein [Gordonia hydrophobica]MBM7365519.1 phosphatidylserine/phosphatidylglycerophosphate/cardiolipin synthase-like enzyme [Gordonia hydrophobica]
MENVREIVVAGDTCWRTGHADRLSVIIDADDYFRHAKAALLQARRRVMLIGWEVDSRIRLDPTSHDPEVPDVLGELLPWLTRTRPDLEIYVLRWSVGVLTGLGRGLLPPTLQDLLTGRRLHYRVDAAHPFSSAHHQKILVIDDRFAFCGGIDMTVDRWDTSDHRSSHPERVNPDGKPYGPWHDATLALDGDAARIVADVARDRWETATGTPVAPIEIDTEPVWPPDLAVDVRDCVVGVSRTLPEDGARSEVLEIRRLYLAAIAAARDLLYIESQYLASRDIAEALAARLAEPDGPEIVVVLPRHADGQVERRSMDGARHRLLRLLWHADSHERFHAYYPVTAESENIYVHAKVLIVDDRLLRIGSSNLNNRSLGFDSECDVALDVAGNTGRAEEIAATIRRIRTRLITEHLGTTADDLDSAVTTAGSLAGAIEALSGDGRGLRVFDREVVADEDSVLAEDELIDPEGVSTNGLNRVHRMLLRRAGAVGATIRRPWRRR